MLTHWLVNVVTAIAMILIVEKGVFHVIEYNW